MAKIDKVLVLLPVTRKQKDILEQAAPEATFFYEIPSGEIQEAVRQADVILGHPPVAALRNAERLRWLQLAASGANAYLGDGTLPDGVLLTSATGAYGISVAEHAFAVLLSIMKRLGNYRDHQKETIWKDLGSAGTLYQANVLILGLGDIGGEFAKRVKAFGAHTIGIRRTHGDKPEFLDELYTTEQIWKLLPEADVVLASLPDTSETYHMIGEKEFSLMKKSAILLNVGRGPVVDTEALCRALQEKKLCGAGLDVTDPEPLPPEHPLWRMENVVITPHCAGGFRFPAVLDGIVGICAKNLEHYLRDEKLENMVDRLKGYADVKK